MAKINVVRKPVERPIESVTIELTEQEAGILRALLGGITTNSRKIAILGSDNPELWSDSADEILCALSRELTSKLKGE